MSFLPLSAPTSEMFPTHKEDRNKQENVAFPPSSPITPRPRPFLIAMPLNMGNNRLTYSSLVVTELKLPQFQSLKISQPKKTYESKMVKPWLCVWMEISVAKWLNPGFVFMRSSVLVMSATSGSQMHLFRRSMSSCPEPCCQPWACCFI